ncbi:MAG: glycosyltransferase family 9 protein [Elusimicrobia bacterium]|nr:glycosyltransferase family 9 protein [Elusimicrobiota bacterium]
MIPERILVIHLKRIGDILLTTPALAEMRRLFPKSRIDFLVYRPFTSILEGNPNIDDIVVFPRTKPWLWPSLLRKGRYDWVIDFLATGASAWASVLSGAAQRIAFNNSYPALVHNVKIPPPDQPMYSPLEKIHLLHEAAKRAGITVSPARGWGRPELYVEQDRKDYWLDVLEKSGLKKNGAPLIMLSPQSRRATRQWRLEGYVEAAKKLAEQGTRVACLWGPDEYQEASKLVAMVNRPSVMMAPQFRNIKDLGAYLSHADCLITNCNGTKHVAVAMGVPTVTIHMSSDPRVWNPRGIPAHPVVRLEKLFCIGCQKNACPYNLECSRDLEADIVVQKTLGLIGDKLKSVAFKT